jgi:hypothetical protein
MLLGPGFSWKRRNPPRRITQVLNCPSTTWEMADVALPTCEQKRSVLMSKINRTLHASPSYMSSCMLCIAHSYVQTDTNSFVSELIHAEYNTSVCIRHK